MSFAQAKQIISDEFKDDSLNVVEFHGGEPMLNFGLIKNVCEWVWHSFPERDVHFFLTTNGTQFTEKNFAWLKEHNKQIVCALSLDGTPEMNMENRGVSIPETTLRTIHELWPKQSIKMTISPLTLPRVSEGIIYAHSFGFNVSANLAYGIDWNQCDVRDYARELDKLVEFYLDHPEVEPCSILEGDKLIKILHKQSVNRHCGAGKTFRAYDTDGSRYPCHVFAGNTLKSSRWNEISETDFADDALLEDPTCKECPIYNICTSCLGMNFIERGHLYSRDKTMCDFIKVEKKAACKLNKQKILSKKLEAITEKEYLILSAIDRIEDLNTH